MAIPALSTVVRSTVRDQSTTDREVAMPGHRLVMSLFSVAIAALGLAALTPRRRRRTSSSFRRWSTGPAPTRRTASRSPTAMPTIWTWSTSATAASTASRSSLEECETGYAHRPRRRMLRAPEGQGPDRRGGIQPAFHRHHLSR